MRIRPLLAGACALLLLALTGCSSGGDDTAGASGTEASALPDGAEQLVGRWAHFDVVAYEDGDMTTSIISFAFLTSWRTVTPARRVTCTIASVVSGAASFRWTADAVFQIGLSGA